MEWYDEAFLFSVRPYGEHASIATLLTREHGLHSGLVYGGKSRRLRPLLQPGNRLKIRWHARMASQLGALTIELMVPHSAALLRGSEAGLIVFSATIAMISYTLPEAMPYPQLFAGLNNLINCLDQDTLAPKIAYILFEFDLIDTIGHSLDLNTCVLTGSSDDLVFVSPKSGRAVSREAGAPWAKRLLPLPAFILNYARGNGPPQERISQEEQNAALQLIGHFISTRVLKPAGRSLPSIRVRLLHI